MGQIFRPTITCALHPLVQDTVEQGAAMVAERRRRIRVRLEVVLRARVLETNRAFNLFIRWGWDWQAGHVRPNRRPCPRRGT